MHSKMDLAPAEAEIMEFLWGRNEGILAKDLLEEINAIQGKEWKKQTLNTYLMYLYQKGLINRISTERKYCYEAKITKEEYKQILLKEFIESVFDGSIPKVISALIGIGAISEEEGEKIIEIVCGKITNTTST